MIDQTFGKNVRYYREAIGMTQEELAVKSGYKSKAAISMIEQGKRDAGTKEIITMAKALSVDVTDLLSTQEPEQVLLNEYIQDEHLRKLILFAGGHMPKDSREKYVEALINAINAMNSVR